MSDYKELAKQLDVDEKTVQRWDKFNKKRDFKRTSQTYFESVKKALAGCILCISGFTFITVLVILSPIGTPIYEWLDTIVGMGDTPLARGFLLLLVFATSGLGIVSSLLYLLDITPGEL